MTTIHETFVWRGFQSILREKTIVGHFLGDRDAYMTTGLSGRNGCIPDTVVVSDYGSSPHGGNFRLKMNRPQLRKRASDVGQGRGTSTKI